MKYLFFAVLQLFIVSSIHAQNVGSDFEKNLYVSSRGDSLPYRLLRPETIKPGEKYPLVLFLHGAGERGNDNQLQMVHGGQMWLNPVYRETYPAFVVMPQCPADGFWAYATCPESLEPGDMPSPAEPTTLTLTLKEMLDNFIAMPEVDSSRIYIMGLSMGGMATFDLAIRFPEIFAAAIPICGTVNPSRLPAAKNVSFRIYHGDADNVVPTAGSRLAYKALKNAGADVVYIEYPGVNHGSWHNAFNDPNFMPWLFSKKK